MQSCRRPIRRVGDWLFSRPFSRRLLMLLLDLPRHHQLLSPKDLPPPPPPSLPLHPLLQQQRWTRKRSKPCNNPTSPFSHSPTLLTSSSSLGWNSPSPSSLSTSSTSHTCNKA